MCELVLSNADRQIIARLKEKEVGVLGDVSAHRVDEKNGAILITCSDGDQIDDVFLHHRSLCLQHRPTNRLHILALNGGAKLIATHSPLRMGHEDEVLIAHAKKAYELKQIETIVLYAHAPCGMAYEKGLRFTQVLELLFAGKDRLKREIPGIKVACFCHVDYDGFKKRTYFVSRERWLEFVAKESIA